MKPASFEYFAPKQLDEALGLLRQYGDEAKILAGGQSLMPLLNMRLARPSVIVDINRITELEHISPTPDGGLHVGALTRERALERSDVVRERNPLLSAAMPFIGHSQIRNRGTLGGSIAHADPAAELPALALALEAELVLRDGDTERVLEAEEFFQTYFTTTMEATELLAEVRFKSWPAGWGWGFEEVCRRDGDFALVGAVALLGVDGNDVCTDSRVVLFGVGGTPVRVRSVEAMLLDSTVDRTSLEAAGGLVSSELEPDSDLHASDEYRREVGGVLTRRALTAALERARQGASP